MVHFDFKALPRALNLTCLSFCLWLLMRFMIKEFEPIYVSSNTKYRVKIETGDELKFETRFRNAGNIGQTCLQLFIEYKCKDGVELPKEFVRIEPYFRRMNLHGIEYVEPLDRHCPGIVVISCISDGKEASIGIFPAMKFRRLFVANVYVKNNEVHYLSASQIAWFSTYGTPVVPVVGVKNVTASLED